MSLLTELPDRLGIGASWLCAAHCALLPVVLALVPALGAGWLESWEAGFVVFAVILGTASMVTGFRRHRTFRAFWFLIPGLALLVSGVATELHGNVVWHAVVMTMGGLLVGLAHLVNLRLSHGHVHDASCGHLPAVGHGCATDAACASGDRAEGATAAGVRTVC
jgi:hypothetical protein